MNVPYQYFCPSCSHTDTVFFADSLHDGNGNAAVCCECGSAVTITLAVRLRKKPSRGRRVPTMVAALLHPCQDAAPAPFAVMVRSNLGVDETISVPSHEEAVAHARGLKILDNHMVCVLHSGKRVVRWDRVNAGGGRAYGHKPPKENRWRRVPIDRPELVGHVRVIWVIYLRNEKEVRAFNATCTVVQPE